MQLTGTLDRSKLKVKYDAQELPSVQIRGPVEGRQVHHGEDEYAEPFLRHSVALESERNARLAALEMAATMVHNIAPVPQSVAVRELVCYDDL